MSTVADIPKTRKKSRTWATNSLKTPMTETMKRVVFQSMKAKQREEMPLVFSLKQNSNCLEVIFPEAAVLENQTVSTKKFQND